MTVLIIYTDITSTHYQCDIFISRQTKICIYSLTKNGFFNKATRLTNIQLVWEKKKKDSNYKKKEREKKVKN